jgi:hypothetical protein
MKHCVSSSQGFLCRNFPLGTVLHAGHVKSSFPQLLNQLFMWYLNSGQREGVTELGDFSLHFSLIILILGFCILLHTYHQSSSSTICKSSLCFTLYYTIHTTCFGLTYRPSSGVIYKQIHTLKGQPADTTRTERLYNTGQTHMELSIPT